MKNSLDKIKSFECFNEFGVKTLESTTDITIATQWINQGNKVIVRNITTGKQGVGIELAETVDQLPITAPLFTKFFPKTTEFRVHVLNGKVIDYVQKKKMRTETLNERGITLDLISCNHKKGWVFAHNDIFYSETITQLGLDATKSVGLDLAAVDILAIVKNGILKEARVCEVNSSPGMSSETTFNKYINAIASLARCEVQ